MAAASVRKRARISLSDDWTIRHGQSQSIFAPPAPARARQPVPSLEPMSIDAPGVADIGTLIDKLLTSFANVASNDGSDCLYIRDVWRVRSVLHPRQTVSTPMGITASRICWEGVEMYQQRGLLRSRKEERRPFRSLNVADIQNGEVAKGAWWPQSPSYELPSPRISGHHVLYSASRGCQLPTRSHWRTSGHRHRYSRQARHLLGRRRRSALSASARLREEEGMPASETVVRAIEGDDLLSRFLKKNQKELLALSLGRMDPSEELRLCGIATMAYEGSESSNTYYVITNVGTHFACTRKVGFMKKEEAPEFVPHVDITHSDYINDAAVVLRCYRGGEEKHFLFLSFYLSAFKGGEQAELAQVSSAMGQAPMDCDFRRDTRGSLPPVVVLGNASRTNRQRARSTESAIPV